jgi:DNA-directed RNA polymerase specialized sigma24 family protein
MLVTRNRNRPRQRSTAGSYRAGAEPRSARFDERALVRLALRGDVSAPGQIFDRHGTALFSLACTLLGDHEDAESVVVEVIVAACSKPGATRPGGSLRHELARLTYLRCVRLGTRDEVRPVQLSDLTESGHGSAIAVMTELWIAARRQRAAIALVKFGDYTCPEVADLLGLPAATVAGLLRSGLRDLQVADGLHCSRGGRRQRLVPRGWAVRASGPGRDDGIA